MLYTQRYGAVLAGGPSYTVELTYIGITRGRYRYRMALLTSDGDRFFGKHSDVISVPSNSIGRAFNDALGFMTVQPGDVEADYFSGYTTEELRWAKSFACEVLAGRVLS